LFDRKGGEPACSPGRKKRPKRGTRGRFSEGGRSTYRSAEKEKEAIKKTGTKVQSTTDRGKEEGEEKGGTQDREFFKKKGGG